MRARREQGQQLNHAGESQRPVAERFALLHAAASPASILRTLRRRRGLAAGRCESMECLGHGKGTRTRSSARRLCEPGRHWPPQSARPRHCAGKIL